MLSRSLLVYNLFPRTIWKDVTHTLFSVVPHDDIVVHISMPPDAWIRLPWIKRFLEKAARGKLRRVIVSVNSKSKGETKGFERVRREIDLSMYDTLTYIHSKGTSRKRKNTTQVRDWTEVMRYFVMDRHDLCLDAFSRGYLLYGINLVSHTNRGNRDNEKTQFAAFHYSGNFVSCNLRELREKVLTTPIQPAYFGLEQFWGNLCPVEKAFCPHQTQVDHYNEIYPASRYRS